MTWVDAIYTLEFALLGDFWWFLVTEVLGSPSPLPSSSSLASKLGNPGLSHPESGEGGRSRRYSLSGAGDTERVFGEGGSLPGLVRIKTLAGWHAELCFIKIIIQSQ